MWLHLTAALADDVMVSARVMPKWLSTFPGARCELELQLLACHVRVTNTKAKAQMDVDPASIAMFQVCGAISHDFPQS